MPVSSGLLAAWEDRLMEEAPSGLGLFLTVEGLSIRWDKLLLGGAGGCFLGAGLAAGAFVIVFSWL